MHFSLNLSLPFGITLTPYAIRRKVLAVPSHSIMLAHFLSLYPLAVQLLLMYHPQRCALCPRAHLRTRAFRPKQTGGTMGALFRTLQRKRETTALRCGCSGETPWRESQGDHGRTDLLAPLGLAACLGETGPRS